MTINKLLPILLVSTCSIAAQPLSAVGAESEKDWVYLQNDELRVGLLRSHGGTIAYLSERDSDFNVLNHYDHGRMVQQSYYGDKDNSRWADKPWRFNPVQGGDFKGKPAKVTQLEATETTAYVKTIPRHWASGELLEDCTMEQWVKLDDMVLEVRYRFTYQGTTTHQPRHQETPAVFVAPELATLVTYDGNQPWTNGKLSRRSPGWPNESIGLTECWAAYVGPDGFGVGIYVPGVNKATCYRFQGSATSDCSYVAPLRTFALVPGLAFEYSAYFTLGDSAKIRNRFAGLKLHSGPQDKSQNENTGTTAFDVND